MANHPEPGLSRRGLLRAGGLTLSVGAVLAACSRGAEAPGRAGDAPVETPLATEPVDDVTYLRTATSLHLTVNDLYRTLLDRDALDGDGVALLERFITDHEDAAEQLVTLTTDNGGDAYECTNTWIEERVLAPLYERLDGNPDADIEPSDDVGRDILGIAYAFESMVGAAHQRFVELLGTPELRREVIVFGARSVRHAAALAILRTGAPDGYVSPVLFDDEIEVEASEIPPIYALVGTFGSLAPVPLFLGGLTAANGRFEAQVETPAENSYIYANLTCDA